MHGIAVRSFSIGGGSKNVKIIVGLGNPGSRYHLTRHNVGFWLTDQLSKKWTIPVEKHKFQAKIGEGHFCGEKIILVKPQTFMNRSGETVRPLVEYFQCALDDLLVVHDEMALEPGVLRLRGKGSAGGHNGLKSVISHLGTEEFPRLRIGVGPSPPGFDAADYVLQVLGRDDEAVLQEAVVRAADAVRTWVEDGIDKSMSTFNRKPEE